uniref:Uncharacterized protein n=1 Tax=Entomoneis paludosa TaxID=265537 RepID=A0A7S2Y8H1_9STRA|mmetsp:Transcript_22389/g.46699  ORF Transcript_22389/g.46699 Transcript_22389/m.46699 type:complete len:126 (+) Transcript_22389:727-1104(+)|eukprot:CAMPEP_0172462718 /NCGR_PEP_ID=MMETSP1065-20121228/44725_1 /TAXON_ID=265537 /ORGANISM="Amphiprora paludosa, Strain CCMP125" /LENGTH=125 /DNA_ID=CAMNT_0013218457 /DNA_START=643 /DNA_END=1020 /DNA_ORIENTATION=+
MTSVKESSCVRKGHEKSSNGTLALEQIVRVAPSPWGGGTIVVFCSNAEDPLRVGSVDGDAVVVERNTAVVKVARDGRHGSYYLVSPFVGIEVSMVAIATATYVILEQYGPNFNVMTCRASVNCHV